MSLLLFSCSGIEDSKTQTRPITKDDESTAQKVGEQLNACSEGELDIHFINTGRGECAFYVLPDGTTMLVDMAGSLLSAEDADGKLPTDPKPNASTSSAEVIVNYINHFTSAKSKGHIDYAMVSHFHEDHMGSYKSTLANGGDGTFKMTSCAEIGTRIPYRHFLDRAYPNYDYPSKDYFSAQKYQNLIKFCQWTESENGTVHEGFDPGALNQISLQYDKDAYSNFKIQNLSASGKYWTGSGQASAWNLPQTYDSSSEYPDENCFSCSFWLSYGSFDFFTGGDLQYNGRSTKSYLDSEAPIAKVMKTVDVAKANHHGTSNANSPELMSALKPTVWVANVWRDVQPNPTTVKYVLNANSYCDIYLTNFCASNEPNFTATQKERFVSTQGHVVIRVDSKGSSYIVYVLNDDDMEYTIKSVKSYRCK